MTLLLQPSFAKGELAPSLHGRVDTSAYKIGLATARNVVIHAYGGASNRPGLEFVGMCQRHDITPRLRRFRFKTTDTYMLEFGHQIMRVIRNDAYVLEGGQAILGVSATDPCTLHLPAHGWSIGDAIEVELVGGATKLNGRRFLVGLGTLPDFVTLVDPITGGSIDGSLVGAYTSGGAAARVYTLATPYQAADLRLLKFNQSADVMTITHNGYEERELRRTSHTSWTLTVPGFLPSIDAPAGLAIVNNTAGAVSYAYQVTSLAAETLEESLPCNAVVTNTGADPANNTLNWTAVPGVDSYSVYKSRNGIFGFIGSAPSNVFTDTNFDPDLGQTPPRARNPFSAPGLYPGASSYYAQRRVFGGSLNNPDTCYYSQTGNYSNMSVSVPVQADDAVTATLTSREVNEVRHFVPGNDLIVFTSGAEWRVNSGPDNGFSATTIRQKPQSAWGSSHLEPLVVGQAILFVPEQANTVRSLGAAFGVVDSSNSQTYTSQELSILSNHLFDVNKTISAWTFSRSPDPLAYCVRSDGASCVMTFHQEQEVTAWSHWDTSGAFEDVDAVRPNADDLDDVAYFVVRRLVNGQPVRYVERVHSRRFTDVRDAFFVDSGVSYDNPIAITDIALSTPIGVRAPGHGLVNGASVDIFDVTWQATIDDSDNETQPDQLNGRRYVITNTTADTFTLLGTSGAGYSPYVSGGTTRLPVQTVAGLDHLEGRTIVALADGNVVSDLVVTGGRVTLPFAASRIHAGLKYVSDLETLNIEAPQGTIQGKWKKLAGITIRFEKSRGLLVGPDTANLDEIKQRQFEAMGDPTELLTGDKIFTLGTDWEHNGRIFMRQRDPLPMTILAVIPDVQVSDQ